MTDKIKQRLALATALFEELMDLSLAQQEQKLREHCVDDPLLYETVRAMLQSDAKDLDLAASVAPYLQNWTEHDLIANVDSIDSAVRRYGPWSVTKEIGRGGMGVVFQVYRQIGALTQIAALKRIKHGMDSDAIAARFTRERSLLGRLKHPHIAQFLDAGTETDGTPWLVMEFVDGLPLLDFIRQKRLELEQRLQLFDQLCDAVSHAHRNLVIHRDLKPNNVMVDQEGQTKLLDFGIAKLLDTENFVTQTAGSSIPMTPQYASPEQRQGQAATTATDVFGLGTLLYEMLCMQNPNTLNIAHYPGAPELAQATPPLPSVMVKNLIVDSVAISSNQLRGDLDLIISKAMARDPALRFATVDALREDVQRHRQQLPIHARAPSWRYRCKRFVQRHRLLVVFASLAFMAILVASGLALWQAKKASAQAARAIAVQEFLAGLFEIADPDVRAGGYQIKAIDLVHAGGERLQTLANQQPDLANDLGLLLARINQQLGENDQALRLLNNLSTASENNADFSMRVFRQLAEVQINRYDANAAILAARKLHEYATKKNSSVDLAHARLLESEAIRIKGDFVAAERLGEEAINIARALPEEPSVLLAVALVAKAGGLWQQNKPDLALPLIEEAKKIYSDAKLQHTLGAIKVENNFCILLADLNNTQLGTPQCEYALATAERHLPRLHSDVLMALGARAYIYQQSGNWPKAIETMQSALDRVREAKGEIAPMTEGAIYTLASVYEDAAQFELALQNYQASLRINQTREGKVVARTPRTENAIAVVLLKLNRAQAADAMAQQAVKHANELGNTDELMLANLFDTRGAISREQGKFSQALEFHQQAAKLFVSAELAPLRQIRHHKFYAETLAASGQNALAIQELEKAEALANQGEFPNQIELQKIAQIRRHFLQASTQ